MTKGFIRQFYSEKEISRVLHNLKIKDTTQRYTYKHVWKSLGNAYLTPEELKGDKSG